MTPNDPAGLRYEIKLTCPARYLHQARTWIRLHPEAFRTAFPARAVNNVYLDTPHLNSLQANLSGVSRRQKLRLRWYGDWLEQGNPAVVDPVIELKVKENLLGSKRREPLHCTLDLSRPWTEILDAISEKVSPYWRPWLNAVTQPTLINSYRREYFASPDGQLRATLDYGLAAFDQRLAGRPNWRARLVQPDRVIIELKAPLSMEERLGRGAAAFPIRRTRSSKYVDSLMATWL